jgi:hypothetical protein
MTMLPAFCREPCGLALKLKQAHTTLERVSDTAWGRGFEPPLPLPPRGFFEYDVGSVGNPVLWDQVEANPAFGGGEGTDVI